MRPDAPAFPELALFVWLSPAFPVGGFAYSHGLEAAAEAGLVTSAAALSAWLDDLARHGSLRGDAILLAAAWRAVRDGDPSALAEANALALALCAGAERHLEITAMGNAFAAALRSAWPGAAPVLEGDLAYPVAVGAASAARGLDLARTVQAYGLAFVANLVSAAVRLGVMGQTDGQRVTAGALGTVAALAAVVERAGLDDLGACAFRSDLAAILHETQYSRLFRS